MSNNERELFQIIRESEDPTEAVVIAISVIAELLKGESVNAGTVA